MNPIIIGLIVVVAMNLFIFPIAYKLQTDKLTDITYALSFATIAVYGFLYGAGAASVPILILTALVLLWAFRLGSFLLYRVAKMGRDKRFDQIRTNPSRFLRFFMLQAVSSWIISLPFLYRQLENPGLNQSISAALPIEWVGWGLALFGLIIEAVADHQKSKFKDQSGNEDKLYIGGLYSVVRFPNYSGEILFWIGIFVASVPAIYSLRWLTISSPIIIILLLVFVSGIPTIVKSRMKKMGEDPDYQSYVKSTKKLIPGIY